MTSKPRYDPQKHHRRSIRLKGYDYAQAGAYFITICTYHRVCLFGEIADGNMHLNEYGETVRDEWLRTPIVRPNVELAEWVVMPNHIHGIVVITSPGRGKLPSTGGQGELSSATGRGELQLATGRGELQFAPTSPSQTVGAIVRGFKAAATKRINLQRDRPGVPVWQRNYWEHIIRNEAAYFRIATYIINNPAQWEADKLRATT